MSEYKYSPKNPIFGETGYQAGDPAEDLPGTAEQKAREAKEAAKEAERIAKEAERKANEVASEAAKKAKIEAKFHERIDKQVAEQAKRQKIRLQKETEASFVNGDFQTLFGPEGTTPDKPLSYETEDEGSAAAETPKGAKSTEGVEINEADEAADVNEVVAVAETPKKDGVSIKGMFERLFASRRAKREAAEARDLAAEKAKTPEQREADIRDIVKDELEKALAKEGNLRNQVRAAAPNLTPEQAKAAAAELQKPENKAKLFDRMKDKIGSFIAGGAGGYAGSMIARICVSTGIRSMFGASLGVGIAAGAVAGGSVEGVKSYIKERNKFSADDILTKLKSAKTGVESAVVISEANKALAEARISHPERIPELTQKIQEAQVVLEAKIKAPEFQNKDEKAKIAFILKSAEKGRESINRGQKKEVKELMRELKFKTEKSKVDWNRVMKSAGKGALVGALGGALGGVASGWVAEHVFHHGAEAGGNLADIHAGHVGQAYSSTIENGKDSVMNANYVEHVISGDKGLTEEARKAIHDYVVNMNSIGANQTPHLSTEQFIFAEDWLVKNGINHAGGILHPGEVINIGGSSIQQAIEHAQNLTPDQMANLGNLISHQPHLISQHTAEWLNDINFFANPDNGNVAFTLIDQATAAAEAAASDPGIMEATALAAGAVLSEGVAYQIPREAAHYLWHLSGTDTDSESKPKSITNVERVNTAKVAELYKDLKIKEIPKGLSKEKQDRLGSNLLAIFAADKDFNKSAYYDVLQKNGVNIFVAGIKNKEGISIDDKGINIYIDNSKEMTPDRAKKILDSLKKQFDIFIKPA